MTASPLSCLQSINRDFIDCDCPPHDFVTIARHVTELRNLHAIHLSDERIAWYNRIIVITLKMPGKEYVP